MGRDKIRLTSGYIDKGSIWEEKLSCGVDEKKKRSPTSKKAKTMKRIFLEAPFFFTEAHQFDTLEEAARSFARQMGVRYGNRGGTNCIFVQPGGARLIVGQTPEGKILLKQEVNGKVLKTCTPDGPTRGWELTRDGRAASEQKTKKKGVPQGHMHEFSWLSDSINMMLLEKPASDDSHAFEHSAAAHERDLRKMQDGRCCRNCGASDSPKCLRGGLGLCKNWERR